MAGPTRMLAQFWVTWFRELGSEGTLPIWLSQPQCRCHSGLSYLILLFGFFVCFFVLFWVFFFFFGLFLGLHLQYMEVPRARG